MRKCSTAILPLIFLILVVFALTACGKKEIKDTDILTQKKTEAGRTPITVLVKNAFTIQAFERAVEEKFPEIDLVQVGNYTSDRGIAEYAARMEHDDLTDVVMTWPLEVGEQYWDDRLIDLSGMEFTSRYNLSMLNKISRDGALYYLPGPAQVRGVVYNKTLFAENGWEVPKNYEEFSALCQTIEASGIRSLQLGFQNKEVLDTAFVGCNYGGYFSKPEDIQWIEGYNQGEGSFGDHFAPALANFQKMIDEGIWKVTDLDVDYSEREKMLFTRQCAMVEDSVLMARMGHQRTGTTDEFALMPFFNPEDQGDWARLYMVCYIGLNKKLAEPEHKEKYDLVMNLMDYISTPEGQEALMADTGAMYSSLQEVSQPDIPEIQELLPALRYGRCAIFPELKNAQEALREGLAGMLKGEMTAEDVIDKVDEQNRNPVEEVPPVVLGTATEDFTIMETGSFVSDAIREFAGTDIALFLDNGKDGRSNGKGIGARIYAGDVTDVDVTRILPDLKAGDTGALWKAELTGENLRKTLEYAVKTDNEEKGWFYYFSGLKMEVDPSAQQGSRIRSITLQDGSAVDPLKMYSVAFSDSSVPEQNWNSCEKTEKKITDIVMEAVQKADSISPSRDGRFVVPE